MLFFIVGLLLQIVFAEELYSHAELRINEGEYPKLNAELREWLESEKETSIQYTKYIKLIEEAGSEIAAPKLLFITTEGNNPETLFADYVPVSMV